MKTLEDFQRDWNEIIGNPPEYLKETRTLYYLENRKIRPIGLEGNQVFFATRYDLQLTFLEREESKRIMPRILEEYFETPMTYIVNYDPNIDKTPEEIEREKKVKEDWATAMLERKKEQHDEKMAKLKYESNLPDSSFSLTFDDFETKTESQKRALTAAKEFCWYPKTEEDKSEDHDYRWAITFHGPTGTGKTMLSYLIAKIYILELELNTYFWNVADLLTELRRGFSDNSYYDLLETVKTCHVLILDDFGMQKDTDWASEQMDSIIDSRYRNDLLTVVTTNVSFKDLPPRMRSRLGEGCVVSMIGGDYRLRIGLGDVIKKKPKPLPQIIKQRIKEEERW